MEIPPHARRRRATATPPPAARTTTTATGGTQPGRPPPSLAAGGSAVEAVGEGVGEETTDSVAELACDVVGALAEAEGLLLMVALALGDEVAPGVADVDVVALVLGDAECVAGFCECFLVAGFLDDFVVGSTGPAGAVGVLVLEASGALTLGAVRPFVFCHTNATEPPSGTVRS
jgi:hypothetical protein